MSKKFFIFVFTVVFAIICLGICSESRADYPSTYNPEYTRKFTRQEKKNKCEALQKISQQRSPEETSLGGGVIPDDVLTGIYSTTRNISNSVAIVSVLGDAIMCHSVHAAKTRLKIAGVELLSVPNVPLWLCGAVVYCFGFMFVLSVTFYIVDISFKLGFAIILLPIGIALWPFDKTKDKIVILITIFLKTAGIFMFLSITVAYAVTMLSEAVNSIGFDPLLDAIEKNDTDFVADNFALGTKSFILVLFSLIYGMKLIGSTIPDYVDKFFPDKAFGSQSPMHHMATQAVDFAKQKAIQPAAKFAADVASTQAGKLTEKTGTFLKGGYHDQLKSGIHNIGRAVRNPAQTKEKLQLAIAHKEAQVISGAMNKLNDLTYGVKIFGANFRKGKDNRIERRESLRNERDQKNQQRYSTLEQNYMNQKNQLNAQINEHERLRDEQKQRQHEQRMLNDPAYRDRINRKEERQENRSLRQERRNKTYYTRLGRINERIKNINSEKEKHLIDTQAMFGKITSVADNAKNNPVAKHVQNLKDRKNEIYQNIDTGKYARDKNDRTLKALGKTLVRGGAKFLTGAYYNVRQAPSAAVSSVFNGGVNTVSAATKLVSGTVTETCNTAVRAWYGLQKIGPTLQKAFFTAGHEAPNVWKAPGVIIEKVGQTMQDHKSKK